LDYIFNVIQKAELLKATKIQTIYRSWPLSGKCCWVDLDDLSLKTIVPDVLLGHIERFIVKAIVWTGLLR
jgi:hypothetical protein